MKINFLIKSLCVLHFAVFITSQASAAFKNQPIDTTCCPPDSLTVVSNTFPVFCVSWHVNTDTSCITPYGFEIQWAYFHSSTWYSAIITYSGGSTINFCRPVDSCRSIQWMVRTICDTLNGGTYSNWVYGPKFAMNCGDSPGRPANTNNPTSNLLNPKVDRNSISKSGFR